MPRQPVIDHAAPAPAGPANLRPLDAHLRAIVRDAVKAARERPEATVEQIADEVLHHAQEPA